MIREQFYYLEGPSSRLNRARFSSSATCPPSTKWVLDVKLGLRCGKGRNWLAYLTMLRLCVALLSDKVLDGASSEYGSNFKVMV